MKLDLILLDVRRNVDNDANICKYNSIYSVVPHSPTTTTTTTTTNNKSESSNTTCCSNLAYMLQQLSETTQCYEARQYLEQQIEYGQCRLRQLQQRQLQTAQQHQHAKEQLQLIVRQQQQARQPQCIQQSRQQQQQQSTQPLTRSRRSRSSVDSTSTPEDDDVDCSLKKSMSVDQLKASNTSALTVVSKKPTTSSVTPVSRKIELEEGRTSPSTTTSTSVISNATNNNAVMKTVAKQILKYIKTSDRYMCFASCLLKSRAFHQTYPMPTATHNATLFLQGSTLPITVSSPIRNRSNSPSNDSASSSEETSTNAEKRNTSITSTTSVQRKLPLIQLPRTKHGKPFVPIKIAGSSNSGTATNVVSTTLSSSSSSATLCSRKSEENKYPLSVSHQYPFVGMIRIAVVDTELSVDDITEPEKNRQKLDNSKQQNNNINNSGSDNSDCEKIFDSDNDEPKQQERNINNKVVATTSSPNAAGAMIGFDIVVFDEINYSLYDTVQEFVVVFQHMFSIQEFKLIIDCYESPEKQLRELYLRWAVKEAYTKALGVGLGYDFSSFQVLLDLESDQEDKRNTNNSNSSANNRRKNGDDGLLLWDWLVATSTNTSIKMSSTSTPSPASSKLPPKVFGVTGSIQHANEKLQTNPERFAFFFCPLYKDDSILFNNTKASSSPASTLASKSAATTTTCSSSRRVNPMEMVGCACACIGPLNIDSDHNDVNCSVVTVNSPLPPSSSSKSSCPATFAAKATAAMNEIECSVEWTDIEQLISWHSPSTSWK